MKEYKFKAKIEPTNLGHGFVFFPFDTQEEFGTRGQIRVLATFDGVPYAGALVKYRAPRHMLPLMKSILQQIGKGPGDRVEVVIKRDDSVRTVEVPAEFAKLMKKEAVLAAFEKMSYTHRKEYCRWITEAKKEGTRQARISKAVEMLKNGVKPPG